jgi:hypothetical protein
MNEVENNEAIQATPEAATETSVETPTQEVETAPPAEASPPSEPSKESPTGNDRYNNLMKVLGDIPETPNEQLISDIDEKSIENLPASAKGLLKHLISQQRVVQQQEVDKLKHRNETLSQREERIKGEARKLIQNRAELNRVLLDPKFQAFLKKSNVPENEMADPFTKEGIQQRIAKGVSEAMTEFQKPITEAAERARQMNAYTEFVESHEKMKNSAFKKDVLTLIENRESENRPVSIEDAYNMVEFERMKKAEETRKAREIKARAKSNRKINRATMSSSNDTGDPVPKWVTEKGYQGARGNTARILYLRDNPKALAKLRDQQKNRR